MADDADEEVSATGGSVLGWVLGKSIVWKNEPSLERNGQLSCVSDPIPEIDQNQFWFALLRVLKNPQLNPLILDVDLTETTDTGFVVEHQFNGILLDKLGQGLGTGENMYLYYKHRLYKERRFVETLTAMKSGKVRNRSYLQIYHDPLRVEGWYEIAGDSMDRRMVSSRLRRAVNTILLRTGIDMEIKLELEYNDDKESLVTTDPLDEYISFERLWNEWVDVTKYHPPRDGVVTDTEVVPVHVDEFLITHTFSGMGPTSGDGKDDGGTSEMVLRMITDAKARKIFVEEWKSSAEHEKRAIPLRFRFSFSEPGEPLRVTAAGELPGSRKADWMSQMFLQGVVDLIVKDPVNPVKKA